MCTFCTSKEMINPFIVEHVIRLPHLEKTSDVSWWCCFWNAGRFAFVSSIENRAIRISSALVGFNVCLIKIFFSEKFSETFSESFSESFPESFSRNFSEMFLKFFWKFLKHWHPCLYWIWKHPKTKFGHQCRPWPNSIPWWATMPSW